MNPLAYADLVIKHASIAINEHVAQSKDQRVLFAFALVEDFVRLAAQNAIREVNITAPGVVIEDRREHGGAVVSDLRGVQDKANG